MRNIFLFALVFWLGGRSLTAEDFSSPYESMEKFSPKNKIDEIQLSNLQKHGLLPANICSDSVFLRRAYLDICGSFPDLEDTKRFLADESPNKRDELIESLFKREEFALYWSLKWGDILRIKSEFPINMWPNAVQAYSLWLWDSIRSDKPYDEFAREIICSSGSNFRDPPSNFYRSTPDRSPEGLAKIAALTFLGSRLENWPKLERREFAKLFSKVEYKKSSEWKEEIVHLSPVHFDSFSVNMPDGTLVEISSDSDPRIAFADWLAGPGRKWFAQAAVNRVWFWLFGRGIVHEADDFCISRKGSFIGNLISSKVDNSNEGNPAANPELLNFLADEFIASGYDFKSLLRLIASSATYQQSCIPKSDPELAEKYFAAYMVRRIDAEILADAISRLAGVGPKYMSVIPEPFTYVPQEYPTIALNDRSISSSFLEIFGRPVRNSGLLSERDNGITYSQRLFLLNSSEIHDRVVKSPLLRVILKDAEGNPERIIDGIYMLVLARHPSRKELEIVLKNYGENVAHEPEEDGISGERKNRKKFKNKKSIASNQIVLWALVNSKEFLFKH